MDIVSDKTNIKGGFYIFNGFVRKTNKMIYYQWFYGNAFVQNLNSVA